MPTSPAKDDGPRMEFPVSLPTPVRPKLAAMPLAVPPDEPAGVRARSYALAVVPKDELTLLRGLNAHSAILVLASTMAPAFFSLRTTEASWRGKLSSIACEPAVVAKPLVSILSLTRTGTQKSGSFFEPARAASS